MVLNITFAGNVGDEKAAPVSGSESLPLQTEPTPLSGNDTCPLIILASLGSSDADRGSTMCDTQVNMSPPTSAPTSAVIRPSSLVVVSQPVPQSGLSPVLTKYKKYLQAYYNARVLATADKYLPTLHTPYINLAMISRGRHDRGERDEFTLKTLHGGVDQILESKSPINIEDLLTPEYQDGITPVYLQGGLTPAHMGGLTPSHLGISTPAHLSGLTPSHLGCLNAPHLGISTPAHIGGLTPSHNRGLTPAHMGGLTPSHLGGLTPSLLGGLTPAHLGGLTPAHLGGLTPAYLGDLTPAYLCGLTPAYLGGLTPAYLGGLTPAYLGGLTPSHNWGLTPAHLGGVTPAQRRCDSTARALMNLFMRYSRVHFRHYRKSATVSRHSLFEAIFQWDCVDLP